MMRRVRITGPAGLAFAALMLAWQAKAQTVSSTPSTSFTQGVACASNGALGYNGNSFISCNSGAWAVQPVAIGTASSAPYTCSSTYQGMMYYDTGSSAIKYCDGSNWDTLYSNTNSALVLISTQTASNSATLQWTGLGSSYNTYLLDCNGLQPVSAADLEFQVGEGSTPTWETSNYAYAAGGPSSGGNSITVSYANSGASAIYLNYVTGSNVSNASSAEQNAKLWISNIQSSSIYKQVMGQAVMSSSNSLYKSNGYDVAGSYMGDTNAITAFRVLYSSGNISAGQCSLYGMSH